MTSTAPASVVPNPEDFRIRVAADRRERMRARLLDAVLDLYQPGRGGAHLVIDDVIQTAGVSRGTFYRSEEHTSELPSLMRTSYADFCLKKKTKDIENKSLKIFEKYSNIYVNNHYTRK